MATVTAAAIFTTTAAHGAPAPAAEPPQDSVAAQAAKLIEKYTGVEDIVPSTPSEGGALEAVTVEGEGRRTVTAPATAHGTVQSTAADGNSIGIGLPSSDGVSGARTVGGTIVYPSAARDADLAVQPTAQGVRSLIVIKSETAAKEYRFGLDLPTGAVTEHQDDGSVIVSKDGEILGTFTAPWAKDARGAAVPTSYRVEDGALVQTVAFDENTAFPVVADPSWWEETKYLAVCGAAVAGVLLSFLPAGSSIKVVRAVALFKRYGAKKTASIIWRFVNGKRIGSTEREAVKAFIGITLIANNCKR
ncbi:hypothetical protein [Streptomyces ficellus]|uniref:Uncharacterized protein n=1 Tax=Streptomyces ficellus TaxID=1977088 RepID=A0A6I6FSP8_9ACTN|nr:hypothetical protein [Streptomyces ficellus]QGV79976.1 hypothetical protein EIZ62_18375 [Streptomyces ficellus]